MASGLHTFIIPTPFGEAVCRMDERGALTELKLAGEDEVKTGQLSAGGGGNAEPDIPAVIAGAITTVKRQLAEYFERQRRDFSLPLNPAGTAFQRRVWCELNRIPYGTTLSYTKLAERVGEVKSVRAVGGANGANPVWIVIPCHRVIGADGSLTGYAGGLEVKRSLLELEGTLSPRLF